MSGRPASRRGRNAIGGNSRVGTGVGIDADVSCELGKAGAADLNVGAPKGGRVDWRGARVSNHQCFRLTACAADVDVRRGSQTGDGVAVCGHGQWGGDRAVGIPRVSRRIRDFGHNPVRCRPRHWQWKEWRCPGDRVRLGQVRAAKSCGKIVVVWIAIAVQIKSDRVGAVAILVEVTHLNRVAAGYAVAAGHGQVGGVAPLRPRLSGSGACSAAAGSGPDPAERPSRADDAGVDESSLIARGHGGGIAVPVAVDRPIPAPRPIEVDGAVVISSRRQMRGLVAGIVAVEPRGRSGYMHQLRRCHRRPGFSCRRSASNCRRRQCCCREQSAGLPRSAKDQGRFADRPRRRTDREPGRSGR